MGVSDQGDGTPVNLADAQADPIATLLRLDRTTPAAAIQYMIVASLASKRTATPPPRPETPVLPAWHLCDEAQKARWRDVRRKAARSYHRAMPIRGLKAANREHEAAVARAVVLEDDLRRVRDRQTWWEALESSHFIDSLDDTQTARKGRSKRAMVLELARTLGASERAGTGRTSPGHALLARKLGVHKITVTRYIRALEAAGFLTTLSAGRSADYGGSGEGALRVVYLLTRPENPSVPRNRPCRYQRTFTQFMRRAGEKVVTPSRSPGECKTLTRTREENPHMEPLRGPECLPSGLFGRTPGVDHPGFSRSVKLGPRRLSRMNRHKVALEVTELRPEIAHVPGLTFKSLRAAIKDFVDAGYSSTDILHMLDWTPQGQTRPHSGLYGIQHGTAWIASVFKPWRDRHGQPLVSPSARKRAADERRERRATERAEQRARERARVAREFREVLPGSGRELYLAMRDRGEFRSVRR